MFSFNKKYFLIAVVFFIIEVLIALFVHDRFVRPYLGDFLVVILIYCTVKSFFKVAPLQVAIRVLMFSYVVELGQYFRIVKVLGLQDNELARTVIGHGFDWIDLPSYTLGIMAVLVLEKLRSRTTADHNKLTTIN